MAVEQPTSNLVVILKNDAGEEFYPAFVVDAQRAEIERCKERAVDAELEMSVQRVTIERLTAELEFLRDDRTERVERNKRLMVENERLRAVLAGEAGLVQLLTARSDLRPERDAILSNHRHVEALKALDMHDVDNTGDCIPDCWCNTDVDGQRPADEPSAGPYCVCGKGTTGWRPNGHAYCTACGTELHPDNYEPSKSRIGWCGSTSVTGDPGDPPETCKHGQGEDCPQCAEIRAARP